MIRNPKWTIITCWVWSEILDPKSYHQQLAAQRGWSREVLTAVISRSKFFEDLSSSDAPRYYFALEEDLVAPGDCADAWECVVHADNYVAIRQISGRCGKIIGYNWERLEDEYGFLTDQPIDPELDPVEVIPAQTFNSLWSRREN